MTTIELGGSIEQAKYAYAVLSVKLCNRAKDNFISSRLDNIECLIDHWDATGERPDNLYDDFEALETEDGTIVTGGLVSEHLLYGLVYNNMLYFYKPTLEQWYYSNDICAKFIIETSEGLLTSYGAKCMLITDDLFPSFSLGKDKLYGVHRIHSIFTLNSPSELVISDKCKISFKVDKYIITPPESINKNLDSCRFYFPTVYLEFGKKYYLIDALFTNSSARIVVDDYSICTYANGVYSSKNGPAIEHNHVIVNCALAPGATYHSPMNRIPYKNVSGFTIQQIEKYIINKEVFIVTNNNFVRQIEPLVYCMRVINAALYAYLLYIIIASRF
jgi:hypothetical protein